MNVSDDGTEMAALGGIDLGGNAVAVSAGVFHTCAPRAETRCWGVGTFAFGQAGYLGTDSAYSGDGGAESISMANLSDAPGRCRRGDRGCSITRASSSPTDSSSASEVAGMACLGSAANRGDNPGEIAALQPVALPAPPLQPAQHTAVRFSTMEEFAGVRFQGNSATTRRSTLAQDNLGPSLWPT